jgi:hypothetical protein
MNQSLGNSTNIYYIRINTYTCTSGYTKKLRAIIQDNNDDNFESVNQKANDNDAAKIVITNTNITNSKNDVDAKLRQLSFDFIGDSNQLPLLDTDMFGTSVDPLRSFSIGFDVNIDDELKAIETVTRKDDDSIPEVIILLLLIATAVLIIFIIRQ